MNSPQAVFFTACTLALSSLTLPASTARADNTAVEVATVNGYPVFHSKVLVSRVKDDIDRALLLQEYEKNENAGLPEGIVEQTIQKIVAENYKGDLSNLISELQKHGITFEDYKQFTSQELVLAAMLTHYDKQIKAGWLAELRKNASIQKTK